jgi:hypothetical protein
MYKRFTIKHQVYDTFGATVGIDTHVSNKQTVAEAIDEAQEHIAGQFGTELIGVTYRYMTLERLVAELHDKAQDRAQSIESYGAPPATGGDLVIYLEEIGKEENYPEAATQEAIHQIEARM